MLKQYLYLSNLSTWKPDPKFPSLISGCSNSVKAKLVNPFGTSNDDIGISDYVKAGVGGIYDGISESITDFKNDYSNTEVLDLLGGGTGTGFMEKACMAAFGVDWGLDINKIVDLAYTQEFATSVMALAPKKNFLFINPITYKPIIEYKGGVYIMPGCEIQGYNIDLSCVSKSEQLKYGTKGGINCGNTNTCNCLSLTNDGPRSATKLSGGTIAQSQTLDRAFSEVPEENYQNFVYDHIRVALTWDKTKYPKCMPDGHEDGVFFFPINDLTSVVNFGCSISASTGQVNCMEGGLSQKLGFGNLQINSVAMGDTAVVGNTFKFTPRVTKTGTDRVCLRWTLFKGDQATGVTFGNGGRTSFTETFQNQDTAPQNVFDSPTVPASILGSSAQIVSKDYTMINAPSGATTSGITSDMVPIASTASGDISIVLRDTNGDGSFTGAEDEYSLDGVDSKNFKTIEPNKIFKSAGNVQVKISSLSIPNQYATKGMKIVVNLKITNAGSDSGQVPMTLVLQGYMPDKDSQSCTSGTLKDISTATYSQKFTVVREMTDYGEAETSCTADGVTAAPEKGCSCGGTGYINCGTGTLGKYCYKDVYGYQCSTEPSSQGQSQLSSQFGTIKVIDSANNIVSTNPSGGRNCYALDSDKDYRFVITKPNGFDMNTITSWRYSRKDSYGNEIAYLGSEKSTQLKEMPAYSYIDIADGVFNCDKVGKCNKGEVYDLNLAMTVSGTAITPLNSCIIINGGTTTGDCGPTGKEGKCQKAACSESLENNKYDFGQPQVQQYSCKTIGLGNCCKI